MDNFNAWYVTCNNWLVPLGFIETFKNHPALVIREFHWIKDGIRICCVYDSNNESYCYIHADIMLVNPISIQSMKYSIGDPKAIEIHKWFGPFENILKDR